MSSSHTKARNVWIGNPQIRWASCQKFWPARDQRLSKDLFQVQVRAFEQPRPSQEPRLGELWLGALESKIMAWNQIIVTSGISRDQLDLEAPTRRLL